MTGKLAKWQSTLIIILINFVTTSITNNNKQINIMEKNYDLASLFKPTKNIPIGLYVLFIGKLNKETAK